MELTELQKLKYWLDAELTILHIMFAVVVWLLTDGRIVHIFIALYILYAAIYTAVRASLLARVDKDFLRVPPKP